MARKKASDTAEVPTFEVQPAPEGFQWSRGGTKAPNPLEDAVLNAVDGDLQFIPAHSDDMATQAERYLRRAARDHNLGVKIRRDETHGGVGFKVTTEKKQRRYTNSDIREWAKMYGFHESEYTPTISQNLRREYRIYHGYETNGEDEQYNDVE